MKKVFVQKIPMGNGENNFLIKPDIAMSFHQFVKRELQDDYCVVTTPMECEILDEDVKIFHIESADYSLAEIKEIIERAKRFDESEKSTDKPKKNLQYIYHHDAPSFEFCAMQSPTHTNE